MRMAVTHVTDTGLVSPFESMCTIEPPTRGPEHVQNSNTAPRHTDVNHRAGSRIER